MSMQGARVLGRKGMSARCTVSVALCTGCSRRGTAHGHAPLWQPTLTGAQVEWGLDHLGPHRSVYQRTGGRGTDATTYPLVPQSRGGRERAVPAVDGTQWHVITDWIATDQALVRPLVEAWAAKYAQEKGITRRDCP